MHTFQKLIAIQFARLSYEEIPLTERSFFQPSLTTETHSVYQALRLFANLKAGNNALYEGLGEQNSRLIFQLSGEKGDFCWVALRSEKGLGFYLLNSDYQPELFFDEAGKLLTEPELVRVWKKMGLGVSHRIEDPQVYVQLLTGQFKGKGSTKYKRYACISSQDWNLFQHLLLQSKDSHTQPLSLLGTFMAESSQPQAIPLTPLRDSLRNLLQHKNELQYLHGHTSTLRQLLADRIRLQADQAEAALLKKQFAGQLSSWEKEIRLLRKEHKQVETDLHSLDKAQQSQLDRIRLFRRLYEKESDFYSQAQSSAKSSKTAFSKEYPPLKAEIQGLRKELSSLYARVWELTETLAILPAFSTETASQQEAKAHQQIAVAEIQIQHWEKQREQERKALERERDARLSALKTQISQTEAALTEAQQQARMGGQSFLSWLENRYPNWEDNIGRLVKTEVLLNPYLSPNVERLNDLFFGISLDVSELPPPDVDLTGLQMAPQEWEDRLTELQTEIQRCLDSHERRQQNLDKRFKQKIVPLQKSIKQWRYEAEQAQLAKKRAQQQQLDTFRKKQQEQARTRLELRYQIEQTESELTQLENALAPFEAALMAASSPSLSEEEMQLKRIELQQAEESCKRYHADEKARKAQLAAQQKDALIQFEEILQLWKEEDDNAVSEQENPERISLKEALPGLLQYIRLKRSTETQVQQLNAGLSRLLAPLGTHNLLEDSGTQEKCWERLAFISEAQLDETIHRFLDPLYAPLLQTLAQQLHTLKTSGPDPQKLQRIQRSLKQIALPPEWKSIRVGMPQTDSPLLQAMQAVRTYADKHGHSLSTSSLFHQPSQEEDTREALPLLLALADALDTYAHDSFSLLECWNISLEIQAVDEPKWVSLSPSHPLFEEASLLVLIHILSSLYPYSPPLVISPTVCTPSWEKALTAAADMGGISLLHFAQNGGGPGGNYDRLYLNGADGSLRSMLFTPQSLVAAL